MPIQSKRANEIDSYINSHQNCLKGKQKIEISGKIDYPDTYMLPISLLQYNHDNGRFNLEIREYEAKIGRKLNPNDPDDIIILKDFLLNDKMSEAEKLYNDLKLIGEQREVAAITYDGIVVNGNRRMATFEKLDVEEPTGKWKDLWVVRLPPDISEQDLWRIEAGLQLSKEKVADYHPVNNLLMIKEGKNADLNEAQIAAAMYGWTEKEVKRGLDRLDLIDTFLQFMGQQYNYGLIKRFEIHEHFIDLQNGVEKFKTIGFPRKEISKKLEVVFAYLRAHINNNKTNSITHNEVRELCKFLIEPDTMYALTESLDLKNIKNTPVEKLAENFDNTKDIKKNKEIREKPVRLLEKAISALNSIDRESPHFKDDNNVKNTFKELYDIVKKLKTVLKLDK